MSKIQDSFEDKIKGFKVIDIKFPKEHRDRSIEIGIGIDGIEWMIQLVELVDNPMRQQIINSMKHATVDHKLMDARLQLR
jgi:hypothetical protein